MLIEFSVKNFRSFKDQQTLSMVANNKEKGKPDHLIPLDAPGLQDVSLLKSVAIFGANASGKSNLIKAAMFVQDFVENSATELKPGQKIDVKPFLLNPETAKQPSEFEVIFLHENIRYQYGFVVDSDRVYEEWLYAYPFGRPQEWFRRKFNKRDKRYGWNFSSANFKGEKESLKGKTRENTLFVSVAAQFNHEQILSVYEWFSDFFRFINLSMADFSYTFTAEKINESEFFRKTVHDIIRNADNGIEQIQVDVKDFDFDQFDDEIVKQISSLGKIEDLKKMKFLDLKLCHRSSDDALVYLDPEDESTGTIKLFSLLGPWIDVTNNGYVVCIDELGAKLHPLLVKFLIEKMNSHQFNDKGAQVIFTTHDTTILDNELLRRDQIWFTEKERNGSTSLCPLSDYKPRNDEALQKGYLAGRYGGIPFIAGQFDN
ncbi:MAG: AAA family ATPase [bacterium]|nr:AAA family ATPase [bacterium]